MNKKIDRATFKATGGGQWEMDIDGIGGASILDETDSSAGGYEMMKAYSMISWDGNYKTGETRIFGSLNAAKEAAKEEIRNYNKRGQ